MWDLTVSLNWDMLSDLVSDDYGTWEFAWRASALAGEKSDHGRRVAATVIVRMVEEGIATVVDPATDLPVRKDELVDLRAGVGWAATEPAPMFQVEATEAALQRVRDMPQEAMDLIARGW